MNTGATPERAATVILLRRNQTKGFEVFLTRRPANMPVLGGMYCFPGGTLRKEDYLPTMLERCVGLTAAQARKIVGAQFRPRDAIGLWVAAIRELFEEVGVLLAVEESGKQLEMTSPRGARLRDEHPAIVNKSNNLLSLLKTERLYCELSKLMYFSHWQTPTQVSRRFDTYFFLAAIPDDQTPLPTSYEVANSLWLTPDRALRLCSRGELPLIFPTFASLRTLADFETLESLLKEYSRDRL